MTADISVRGALDGGHIAIRWRAGWLRVLVVASGLCASVLFVVVGFHYELQMYGDGSIFSYSIAVQDAWAFHWHNISGRLLVYAFCYLPAEAYVGLSGDARGGIAIYGLLFFGSQLLGLAATFAADRSRQRIIFCYACLSVACVCPLVFGSPTELWVTHAMFWPALAICHYARSRTGGFAAVVAALAALIFTHEGAAVFAAAILATLLLRGARDSTFRRALAAFLFVTPIWILVKTAFPPDDNFAHILPSVARNALDIASLGCSLFLLLGATLAANGIACIMLRRMVPLNAHICAALIVALALAVYWLRFDTSLHADSRYYLRTALLMAAPSLGALAAWQALDADGAFSWPLPFLANLKAALARDAARAIAGAVLLMLLVHTVETAKFVNAWTSYTGAVRGLAMGPASDPGLGGRSFVSAARIDADLNRLSWPSTTQYLSVLVAPMFSPRLLVVDPRANYFWISCKTAVANQGAERAVPQESRMLVRLHACLHR